MLTSNAALGVFKISQLLIIVVGIVLLCVHMCMYRFVAAKRAGPDITIIFV